MVSSYTALLVIVGVASALAAAFIIVLCKCLWVWCRYRRHRSHPPKDYQTYSVTSRTKWPSEYTYQTYENIHSDVDSIDSEEPYIIETPGDLGKVQMEVDYNSEHDVLVVGLVQAKGIICKTNVQTAQVYPVAQIYDLEDTLLDERKVEKQPMSFNPQWNDELLFALNGRATDSLQVVIRILELDSFSNEHVIGQIKMPVTEMNVGTPGSVWYDLTDINKIECEYVGDILLSLNYFPTTQRLTIVVLKARQLKIESTTGLWGPLVKVFFNVNKKRVGRKRTAMQKKTFNPVYNEAFAFKVSQDALPKITFRVLVINKTSHGQDEVIGHVTLGQHVVGSGFSHWSHMLTTLRKPVAMWHPIIPVT
ncbi:synaptotagmin-5-like [Actinia tenebrosa]|uniref:Synaptotagmin-5-like n=1 Tax=Actinia tenebrosa TaxID=6105 RepID=A0A6P8IUG9_ACTTE|nr:synaptotagmin-5-like [Actinia tenebrosa]